MDDLELTDAFIITPAEQIYKIKNKAIVTGLSGFINMIQS